MSLWCTYWLPQYHKDTCQYKEQWPVSHSRTTKPMKCYTPSNDEVTLFCWAILSCHFANSKCVHVHVHMCMCAEDDRSRQMMDDRWQMATTMTVGEIPDISIDIIFGTYSSTLIKLDLKMHHRKIVRCQHAQQRSLTLRIAPICLPKMSKNHELLTLWSERSVAHKKKLT